MQALLSNEEKEQLREATLAIEEVGKANDGPRLTKEQPVQRGNIPRVAGDPSIFLNLIA